MNVFIYVIKTSVIRLIRSYKTSMILLLSFMAGLILPAFCLANANYFQEQLDRVQFDGYKKTVHTSFMSLSFNAEMFDSFKASVDSSQAQVLIRNWDVIPEFRNSNATILGIGGEYQFFEGVHTVQGRSFTSLELLDLSKVCMVSQEMFEENKCRIGDSISIHGSEFEIIGSMDDSSYVGYILLPYMNMTRLYPGVILQNTIDFQTEDIDMGVSRAGMILRQDGVDIVELKEYAQLKKANEKMISGLVEARMICGLFAYIFSFINILMFTVQKMQDYKRRYAIQEVCGMDVRRLYQEIFIDNLLLITVANAFVYMVLTPLGRLFGLQHEMRVGVSVFIVLFLLSLGTVLVISAILVYKYSRIRLNSTLVQEE